VRLQAGLDGGGLMDVGCYCISGCRTLAGTEPERGYLETLQGGDGVDVAAAALLRFPGDVFAHFDCGLAYPGGAYLGATGTDGVIFMADPWHAKAPVIELRRPGEETERIEVGAGENSYALELADFAAAAAGEGEPLLGRADALGQARTIAALYQSAEKGTPCPIT
jgi:predicted dehydrogenase